MPVNLHRLNCSVVAGGSCAARALGLLAHPEFLLPAAM
jgi:hypothetical protein